MTSKRMSCTKEREYHCGLEFLFQELAMAEEEGLRYVVVGGVALAAWSGEIYKPVRSNGSLRDVDVLVIDDPKNCVEEIEKRLRLSGLKFNVDFSHVKPKEYRSRVSLFPQLKRTEMGHSFVFRSVEVPLSAKALKHHWVSLTTSIGTIPIRTFHPHVLLHRYLIRLGALKAKDIEKVRAFARHMKSVGLISFSDHADYREYHEFARRVKERYPWYMMCLRVYNYVDHKFFNSLLSHRLIPHSILRYLIAL